MVIQINVYRTLLQEPEEDGWMYNLDKSKQYDNMTSRASVRQFHFCTGCTGAI